MVIFHTNGTSYQRVPLRKNHHGDLNQALLHGEPGLLKQAQARFDDFWSHRSMIIHGSLNVPIEHHPTIRYMVYNGYYKVMSNISKMGQLPTPVIRSMIINVSFYMRQEAVKKQDIALVEGQNGVHSSALDWVEEMWPLMVWWPAGITSLQ